LFGQYTHLRWKKINGGWLLATGCLTTGDYFSLDKVLAIEYSILDICGCLAVRNNQYPMLNTEFPGKD
jgi:hypothetical protein